MRPFYRGPPIGRHAQFRQGAFYADRTPGCLDVEYVARYAAGYRLELGNRIPGQESASPQHVKDFVVSLHVI